MLKRRHVLIEFDLNPALSNKAHLKAQLEDARARLERILAHIARDHSVALRTVKIKSRPDALLNCLRMLDAKAAAKKTNVEIARILFRNVIADRDDEAARDYLKSRLRRAKDLVRDGYLNLAAS